MDKAETYQNDVSTLLMKVNHPVEKAAVIYVNRGRLAITDFQIEVKPRDVIFRCSVSLLEHGPNGPQWDAIRIRINQAIQNGILS